MQPKCLSQLLSINCPYQLAIKTEGFLAVVLLCDISAGARVQLQLILINTSDVSLLFGRRWLGQSTITVVENFKYFSLQMTV